MKWRMPGEDVADACSTPLGIKEAGIGSRPTGPSASITVLNAVGHQRGGHGAQIPATIRVYFVLNAVGHQRGGHGIGQGVATLRHVCSTPLGIKEAGILGNLV